MCTECDGCSKYNPCSYFGLKSRVKLFKNCIDDSECTRGLHMIDIDPYDTRTSEQIEKESFKDCKDLFTNTEDSFTKLVRKFCQLNNIECTDEIIKQLRDSRIKRKTWIEQIEENNLSEQNIPLITTKMIIIQSFQEFFERYGRTHVISEDMKFIIKEMGIELDSFEKWKG